MTYSKEERNALKALDAKSFRSLTKEQIVEFVSSIPNMSKEVAMKCLEQVPYYMESASSVVHTYADLCRDAMTDNVSESEIEAHRMVLDACQMRIDAAGENMSHEEYMNIMGIMTAETQAISKVVDRHLSYKDRVLKYAGGIAMVAITTAASLLGVKSTAIRR